MTMYIHFFEIEPVEIGAVYTPLPLHCTLMGWFSTVVRLPILENITREVCARHRSFEMISGDPSLFGPNNDLPVFTLLPAASSLDLHLTLFTALERIGVKLKQPSFFGLNYRMHVTTIRERSFSTGSRKMATRVILAEIHNSRSPASYRILAACPLI